MSAPKTKPGFGGAGSENLFTPTGQVNADATPDLLPVVSQPSKRTSGGPWGATPDDWAHFDLILGLTTDLLPVVSNPHAEKSPDSKIQGPGKTPSDYNTKGLMRGFANWTSHQATPADIAKWSAQPDYGICLQMREARAIDVDVDDPSEAAAIEQIINERLAVKLPVRRRDNASKFLMLFLMPGDFKKRRFSTKTDKGAIEFLANGQQFVAVGTHPSGARYVWPEGLPNEIPELTEGEFFALWSALHERFGSTPSTEARSGKPLSKPRTAADISDPMVDFLYDEGHVLSESSEGKIFIRCPNEAEHTTDSGETATAYFPAGVGGYEQGHFACLHSHCQHLTDHDFKAKIGYLDRDMPVVDYTPTPEESEIGARRSAEERERLEIAASRKADAAIQKARFSSGREAFEKARREYQKKENERIGEGESTIPPAEQINLAEAIERYVFLADGSRVVDLFNPHYDLTTKDWANNYAASFEAVKQPDRFKPDGTRVPVPDKETPVASLWLKSPKRKSAICRTFKAGGGLFLKDPNGRPAVNSWRGFDRSIEVDDLHAAGLGLFLDHVDFLFGADAGRFLDWLAHIEQNPGELPHTGWLHIATSFGMGRNWLASVLVRVWAGYVAPNFDLVGTLSKGFNDRLAGKVLAVVDEIREGGRDSQWEHAERLKSLINEEQRTINAKYGRICVEYNACRWLMFSQHLTAIPMEKGDRRIEVVVNEGTPKPESYYTRLYSALDNPRFIAAVAAFLARRDISTFNPGAHAKQTEAKQAATKASQTQAAGWCELLVKHWPSDLITSGDLYEVLEGPRLEPGRGLTPAHRRTLEQFGIESYGKTVKVDQIPTRVLIVRNRHHWRNAAPDAIRAELNKRPADITDARHYLEEKDAV